MNPTQGCPHISVVLAAGDITSSPLAKFKEVVAWEVRRLQSVKNPTTRKKVRTQRNSIERGSTHRLNFIGRGTQLRDLSGCTPSAVCLSALLLRGLLEKWPRFDSPPGITAFVLSVSDPSLNHLILISIQARTSNPDPYFVTSAVILFMTPKSTKYILPPS